MGSTPAVSALGGAARTGHRLTDCSVGWRSIERQARKYGATASEASGLPRKPRVCRDYSPGVTRRSRQTRGGRGPFWEWDASFFVRLQWSADEKEGQAMCIGFGQVIGT